MMSRRIESRAAAAVPADLPDDLHPVLARVYAARGVRSGSELQLGLDRLEPFDTLLGIGPAVSLLAEALEQRWRVLVVGDFDVDGATSTALAVRGLRAMGAAQVDFLVPNRFRFGYGLTPEIVAVAAERKPDLLLTVDNGIASLAGVAAARAHGMRVLITDHHLPGHELPAADAIVNPNQPGCAFPSKHLAGVGVMFYVLLALRAHLRKRSWFAARALDEPNLARYLDLVALGTVADVVALDRNNRILVSQGMARMRAGQACTGLDALLRVAGRTAERLGTADLGFVLGPRLNAAGRLDDMEIGIRLLLADTVAEAEPLARELDALNRERRAIESTMKEEALAIVERMRLETDLPHGLCLYQSDWHEGVVGIVASRLKDRVHRPVVVFTDGNEGELKGSARSIPGLHIRDVFDAVATQNPGVLVRFGGHAMAAGLAIRRDDLERFCAAFDGEVRTRLGDANLEGVLFSDGGLRPDDASLALAEQIRAGGPWGQGFPEPLFDGRFEIVDQRVVGEKHLKLALRWPGRPEIAEGIAFNTAPLPRVTHAHAAFRLDINEYRGQRAVQLVIEHLVPA